MSEHLPNYDSWKTGSVAPAATPSVPLDWCLQGMSEADRVEIIHEQPEPERSRLAALFGVELGAV